MKKRYFNTSGPNIEEEHYTIQRTDLIKEGTELVEKQDYKVAQISFETYIQAFLQVVDGKSYREADTGLGKSDLIINVRSVEYLIETKIYYYESQFLNGQ